MAESLFAFGIGTGTPGRSTELLEVFYPAPLKSPDAALRAACTASGLDVTRRWHLPDAATLARLASALADAGLERQAEIAMRVAGGSGMPVVTILAEDSAPGSTAEAYLKLHLLSHRLALPNSMNLSGIFATLPNVAWTSKGPLEVADVQEALLEARLAGGTLGIHAIDKFPRMLDYVVPSGVRIADASRIRLGAYLGEGSTVMHEGFVNFNAGALGPNMIEGRISQGVVIGEGTDLGGSASTMGTLSGGNDVVISLGKHCLIGANAGTGIPLGDRCTIAAGLYITAGTTVDVVDENRQRVRTVKARELAFGNDMLFVRNGETGRIECRTNRAAIELNESLHAHN